MNRKGFNEELEYLMDKYEIWTLTEELIYNFENDIIKYVEELKVKKQ